MKSKKKTKVKKKKMFGGLNKLPTDLIKKIANQGNGGVGVKLTHTAKLGLNKNNREDMRKKYFWANYNDVYPDRKPGNYELRPLRPSREMFEREQQLRRFHAAHPFHAQPLPTSEVNINSMSPIPVPPGGGGLFGADSFKG